MNLYARKCEAVEAFRLDNYDADLKSFQIPVWFLRAIQRGNIYYTHGKCMIKYQPTGQDMEVNVGDWLVKEVHGVIERYSNSAFHARFEPVEPVPDFVTKVAKVAKD